MVDEYEHGGGLEEDPEDRIDHLEERIEQLESDQHNLADNSVGCFSLIYGMGMSLAMILSWSRNGSIAWCIVHGLLSWGYVIYFAFFA